MKKIFFVAFMALMLALTSCEKEEILETSTHETSKVENLAANSNFRRPPISGATTLSPYVVHTGTCYGTNHSGNTYETLVYVTGAKPYHRKVTVFGWRNGNMSSIPNTYQIDIPANSTTSTRVGTFNGATMAYSSIKVEINQVLKQNSSGQWVTDNTGNRTTATISVQNCYDTAGGGGGFGGVPSL